MSNWMEGSQFQAAIRAKNEADWQRMLLGSAENNIIENVIMPLFPQTEMQVGIHGTHGKTAMAETIKYFTEVKKYAIFCNHEIDKDRRLLDFGTGWGRMLRPWMRDISLKNIFGVDPHPLRIVTARSCNPYVSFFNTDTLPPLVLREHSIDYIIAYSVFSHLDEFSTLKWFAEFKRILRPGGLLAVTTQRRSFINSCEDVRKQKQVGKPLSHPWQEALAKSFVSVDDAHKDYDEGKFLFSATSGIVPHVSARYGEAVISPQYVRRNLCEGMDFIDFVDNPERLPQALIVLQKPKA